METDQLKHQVLEEIRLLSDPDDDFLSFPSRLHPAIGASAIVIAAISAIIFLFIINVLSFYISFLYHYFPFVSMLSGYMFIVKKQLKAKSI